MKHITKLQNSDRALDVLHGLRSMEVTGMYLRMSSVSESEGSTSDCEVIVSSRNEPRSAGLEAAAMGGSASLATSVFSSG